MNPSECSVCGSVDYFHDEISDSITCQNCGAVVVVEQTQVEQNIAEYQRSLIATTSSQSTATFGNSNVSVGMLFGFQEAAESVDSYKTPEESARQRADAIDFSGLTEAELVKILKSDGESVHFRIYQYQKFIISTIADWHLRCGLPDITRLFMRVWRRYLYTHFNLKLLKESLLLGLRTVNTALSLLLVCYVYCGCGIVANDIIKWIFQGKINFEAACQNALFRAKEVVSCRHLENTAMRISKIIQIDMNKRRDVRFRNMAFRGCKNLGLPRYVAQMAIRHWSDLKNAANFTSNDRGISIYGMGKLGYSIPVEASAVTLYVCRRIWPVFLIPPAPLPFEPCAPLSKQVDSGNPGIISMVENNNELLGGVTFDPQRMAWDVRIVTPIDESALDYVCDFLLRLREQRCLVAKHKPFLCKSFRSIMCALNENSAMGENLNKREMMCSVKTFDCVDKDMQTSSIEALNYLKWSDPIAYDYTMNPTKFNSTAFKRFIVEYMRDKRHRKFFEGLHARFYSHAEYSRLRCSCDTWLKQRGHWSGKLHICAKGGIHCNSFGEHDLPGGMISSNQAYMLVLNRFIHSNGWSVEDSLDPYSIRSSQSSCLTDLDICTLKRGVHLAFEGKFSHGSPGSTWRLVSNDMFSKMFQSVERLCTDKSHTFYHWPLRHVPKDAFAIVQNFPLPIISGVRSCDCSNKADCLCVYYELNNSYTCARLGNSTLYVMALILLSNFFGLNKASIHQCLRMISLCER